MVADDFNLKTIKMFNGTINSEKPNLKDPLCE